MTHWTNTSVDVGNGNYTENCRSELLTAREQARSYRSLGYLPMQKLEKIRPSKSSELNAPVISPSEC